MSATGEINEMNVMEHITLEFRKLRRASQITLVYNLWKEIDCDNKQAKPDGNKCSQEGQGQRGAECAICG